MKGKRIISSILSMAMVFTLNAGISFADEVPVTEEPTVEEQPVIEDQPVVEEQPVIEEEPVVEEQPVETEPEIEQQEEETEEESEYPAQTFTGVTPDGKISVEVNAPEGALPKDASMRVENVNSDTIKGLVESVIDGEADTISAVNVIFTDADGHEVEPLVEIIVNIKMVDFEAADSYQLVHIDQANHPDKIADEKIISINNTETTFATDVFSVYAVIGQAGPEANYRKTVNFYNGSTLIATMYVKNADRTNSDALAQILYDPGAGTIPSGQMFKGWSKVENYTNTTPTQTIDQIREEIANTQIVNDGETVNYYAVIISTYTVTYLDEDNNIVGTEAVTGIASESSREFVVNMNYTPKDAVHNFEGWKVARGATNITDAIYGELKVDPPYANGTKLTITGDVTLSVNAPEGFWLIFDENGDNATYNAPQFVKQSDVTHAPRPDEEMVRTGYTFGGWYKDADCTEEFEFGEKLDKETVIYANWIPEPKANYTVIIWLESATSDDEYDYKTHVTLEGDTGTTINTVSQQGSGKNSYISINGEDYQYPGFSVKEYDTGKTIAAEGNTVVNVKFQRNTYTLSFQVRRSGRWTNVATIEEKYGRSIIDRFPISGYNNYMWQSQGGSTFERGLYIIIADVMPAEDVTFHGENSGTAFRMRYYVQPTSMSTNLDDYELINTITSYTNSMYLTYDEDFMELQGFERQSSNPEFDYNRHIDHEGWGTMNVNFYYTRKQYPINYMDGAYFDGDDNPVEETNQNQLKVVNGIAYQKDISSYNKGGADSYTPTRSGYTFVGWYADPACKEEYKFTTMPLDGITVYAKWVKNQYRVFLHPNAGTDSTLDWGSDTQAMTFRLSSGEKVSAPTGKRKEYEFVGWYLDENCTQVFNAQSYILNDSTVTGEYDKETDFTDPMDKWGNGATYNSDVDRDWITKKLDIYAKWRAILVGAKGINIVYDANGGTNPPTDSGSYLDNSSAIAQAASTAPTNKVFKYWVVQKWNGSDYEPTSVKVSPGEEYTVLKEYAKAVEDPDSTSEKPIWTYTVCLKAEYADVEDETPTHITWHANNGADPEPTITDDKNAAGQPLKINEPIDIRPATTFTNPGYEFIGWAKKANATKNELFLKYENGKFYADKGGDNWVEVTQVAADEVLVEGDYDHLYAIWDACIYLWHSSNHYMEPISIQDLKTSSTPWQLNVQQKVNTAEYYYGGCYHEYSGNTDESYDTVVGNRQQQWQYDKNAADKGIVKVPQNVEAGKTYYLKEVPKAYLSNYSEGIYKKNVEGNPLTNMFELTAFDDLNYQVVGYEVTVTNKWDSRTTILCKSFTFKQDSGVTKLRKANNVTFGIEHDSYLAALDFNKEGIFKANNIVKLTPYWITPDNVRVTGNTRTISLGDLQLNSISVSD